MKKRGLRGAKELMDELEKKPEFVRRRDEKAERRRRLEEMYAELARPAFEALHAQGFEATTVQDLVRKYAPLPVVAVEILLNSLETCENDRMCESFVRAVGAAQERFDGRLLASKYDHTHDEGLRFAVLNTIALTRPHSIDGWLAKIGENPFLRKTLSDLGYRW